MRYEYGEGADIVFEQAGEVRVEGYEKALRSSLENILRNAMQHSNGAGRVTASLRTEGGEAVISIVDEGGGVADGDLDSIFEPFYRASSRRDGSGTGLGLAIAKRAIELNDGSVRAANAEPGLCVEIRLPLAR